MNRREFISATAATAMALPAVAEDKAVIEIVDTHQHLWDLKKLKLAWVTPGHPLAADFTPVEYAKAIEGLNVTKAVYMEVDVVPEQQQAEAEYLIELIKSGKTPTCAAVVSGRPNTGAAFRKYVAQFKGSPVIKGIRQVLHVDSTPPGYCLTKAFVEGIRHLGEIGLSFDLCIRPADLPDALQLVRECPETRFILDHCGNPFFPGPLPEDKDGKAKPVIGAVTLDKWKKDLAALAAKKNVVCKISGLPAHLPKDWTIAMVAPVINHVIEVFGWDRVMFAGDWPVCTLGMPLRKWVETVKEVVKDQSDERKKKLFHDNAVKFYGL